jgi:hypothetical protein
MRLLRRRCAAIGLTLLLLAACSDESGEDAVTTTTVAPTTVASTTTTDPRDVVTDDDQRIADDFIAWARSHDSRVPALADSVRLILGPEAHTEVVLDDPHDRSTWVLPVEDFRAYVGPFNPLNSLAGPQNVTVRMGPHQTCAAPAPAVPADLAPLRQIAIEASDIDSCLSWFSIDLFVNDAGLIEAVIFDLYEP